MTNNQPRKKSASDIYQSLRDQGAFDDKGSNTSSPRSPRPRKSVTSVPVVPPVKPPSNRVVKRAVSRSAPKPDVIKVPTTPPAPLVADEPQSSDSNNTVIITAEQALLDRGKRIKARGKSKKKYRGNKLQSYVSGELEKSDEANAFVAGDEREDAIDHVVATLFPSRINQLKSWWSHRKDENTESEESVDEEDRPKKSQRGLWIYVGAFCVLALSVFILGIAQILLFPFGINWPTALLVLLILLSIVALLCAMHYAKRLDNAATKINQRGGPTPSETASQSKIQSTGRNYLFLALIFALAAALVSISAYLDTNRENNMMKVGDEVVTTTEDLQFACDAVDPVSDANNDSNFEVATAESLDSCIGSYITKINSLPAGSPDRGSARMSADKVVTAYCAAARSADPQVCYVEKVNTLPAA